MKEVKISELQLGDLIFVRWNDASIDTARLPTDQEVESPVHTVGIFLGIRGLKHKHLLLGRSKLSMPQYWEADRIPVEMIDFVMLIQRGFLGLALPEAKLELKKIKICKPGNSWHLVKVKT